MYFVRNSANILYVIYWGIINNVSFQAQYKTVMEVGGDLIYQGKLRK